MKDATSALRKAYLTLLDGITIAGVLVPVYDDEVNDTIAPFTRENPPKKYIIISNQNSADQSAKCSFQARHTIQVDSIAVFNAYSGSSRAAEEINEAVVERVLTSTAGNLYVDGFNCYRGRIDLSRNLTEKTKTQNIYRRITIFNHSIQEI